MCVMCVVPTVCMCQCVHMHIYSNATRETYPLSRKQAFIGIIKANVSVCMSIKTYKGKQLSNMQFGHHVILRGAADAECQRLSAHCQRDKLKCVHQVRNCKKLLKLVEKDVNLN